MIKEKLLIQLFSPFYDKHKIKKEISEKLGSIITEKNASHLLYRSLSFEPRMNFEEFERVYKNPMKYGDTLYSLVRKTAQRIIGLL